MAANTSQKEPWFVLALKIGRGPDAVSMQLKGGPRLLSTLLALIGLLASPGLVEVLKVTLSNLGS